MALCTLGHVSGHHPSLRCPMPASCGCCPAQIMPPCAQRRAAQPQHYASRNGHGAICQFLLQSGARCNAQTHGGATALHRASYCGHVDVARLLLAHGADPGIADDDGMTSLHKAAEGGHRELCELLLQHSPGLKGVQDRRARRACDLVPSSGALRDLLET
ncbi:ankyrin repeat domain-containing protein 39 [Trachemys scripta elegans]|uniref:ankyrin repeat domain-containing protein 39 n=1 Tax=Trachemys scripta elegans TaxID=31138 RepID=UPI00155518EF|nr:ankyrin repeat domain-containing protein 39 [Trachemys scripta elegans]